MGAEAPAIVADFDDFLQKRGFDPAAALAFSGGRSCRIANWRAGSSRARTPKRIWPQPNGGSSARPRQARRPRRYWSRAIETPRVRPDRARSANHGRGRQRAEPVDALSAGRCTTAVGVGCASLGIVGARCRRRYALLADIAIAVRDLSAESTAARVARLARVAVRLARVESPEPAHVAGSGPSSSQRRFDHSRMSSIAAFAFRCPKSLAAHSHL